MNRFFILGILIATAPTALPLEARAQPERYELGRRLRVFEAAWENAPGEGPRKHCVEPLKKAVQSFFSLNLSGAGEAIDRARYAVESDKEPSPERLWAESLASFPAKRLIDAGIDSLPLELRPFYVKPRPANAHFSVQFRLLDGNGRTLASAANAIGELPQKIQLPLRNIPAGDHRLQYEVTLNEKALAQGSIGISVVEHLTERVARFEKLAAEWTDASSTERATFQSLVRLLGNLAQGKSEESDYPAARLVAELDGLALAKKDNAVYFNHTRPGQHWITLVTPRETNGPMQTVPVRILAPAKSRNNSPMPLVIALHGAGGTENLFFDGYGNGKIVSLCEQRGWLLVAPRCGQFGGGPNLPAVINELRRRYPIDADKVFLVGHSMGAAFAVQAACQEPTRFAGVVALGGSGFVRPSENLKKLPFYLGCGTEDFALSGARSLKARLEKAGVEHVSMHEFESIEHLGIVQQALADAFHMFDAIVHPNDRK
jgi:predicted esterase